MTSSVEAVTASYFRPFLGFVKVEVMRAVKEEGPFHQQFNQVGRSPVLKRRFGQKDPIPIAVNRLCCTNYERLAGLLY